MAIVLDNRFNYVDGAAPGREYVPYPGPIVDPHIGPLDPGRYSRQENIWSNVDDPVTDIDTNDQPIIVKKPTALDRIMQGLGLVSEVYTSIKYPDGEDRMIETEIEPGYDTEGLQPWHFVAIIGGLAVIVLIAVKLKPGKE